MMNEPSAAWQGVGSEDQPHQGHLPGEAVLAVNLLQEPAHIPRLVTLRNGNLTHRPALGQASRHAALSRGQSECRGQSAQ